MKRRVKTPSLPIPTREQAKAHLKSYAQTDRALRTLQNQMEQEIETIKSAYQNQIDALNQEAKQHMERLQTYAESEKNGLLAKKRSTDLTYGTIGFRTGTPKLKTQKGLTWADVVEKLQQHAPRYLRVVKSPAKDKLLADREALQKSGLAQTVGVRTIQEETFFIQLNTPELNENA